MVRAGDRAKFGEIVGDSAASIGGIVAGEVRRGPPQPARSRKRMELKGLLIREKFVGWILDGLKTWEIRGSATKIRGPIALIKSGSGTIVGTCELFGVVGPLTLRQLRANAHRLNVKPSELEGPLYYGDHTYAWELDHVRRLKKPVPYTHPSGAVIWVKLPGRTIRRLGIDADHR
jgi:hypothetical protein